MKIIDKTLIAGPWVGEFGWELFAWQAYIRALSRNFLKTIVIGRTNSKHMYSDFADEFFSCDIRTGDSDSFFMIGCDTNKILKEVIMNNNLQKNKNIVLVPPRRIGNPPFTHYTKSVNFGNIQIIPEYVIFKSNKEYKYDYVFHARNRELRKEDNWSIENWKNLKNSLNAKIACIGSKTQSVHVEGTDDLRGISFEETVGVIKGSKAVFGPSSGPMHLSSLCGAPHVVWSKKQNRNRYEEFWNPLQTPILFLDEHSWHPPAEYVYKRYKNWKTK
tara:strand:+ start:8216 stop:9037 length:822 start_codon:yes stop_codon:yes gene_type:complete